MAQFQCMCLNLDKHQLNLANKNPINLHTLLTSRWPWSQSYCGWEVTDTNESVRGIKNKIVEALILI